MSYSNPLTYKKLIEKYPEAKEDLEILKEEKNIALYSWIIIAGVIGILIGYVVL